MLYRKLITIFILYIISINANSEQITIAVSANFSSTIKEIVAEFKNTSHHQVRLVFGSSGKLYAQIRQGAPFDLFFSADQAKPLALENNNLTVIGSRFTYALGALALWSHKPDLLEKNINLLKKGNFNTLAIANPKLAPFGAAAVEVLKNLALKDSTQAKWVQGESISQTYQFIASGNADLGFIGLSQLIRHQQENQQNKKSTQLIGSSWIVPQYLHKPIRQDAVILRSSKKNMAIQAFLHYFHSEKAKNIIKSYGYQIPPESI